MNRGRLVEQVSEALGDRRLVWFGTRGDDAESAMELPQFHAAFSIIGRYTRRPSLRTASLEELTGVRPDLDTFELDDHLLTEEVAELRAAVLRSLSGPSALFSYRPSTFLSAIGFARDRRCRHLGMFKAHQFAFEHKPWVETILRDLELPMIQWTYVPDIELLDVERRLERGPLMLRRSRTTGGVGLTRVDAAADLDRMWPQEEEAFVSVADYIPNALPVNVSAVIWDEGITLHPASVQLIGVAELTLRAFGYCGNDFGAAADLGVDILEDIEYSTLQIASRLRTYGYRGAFGVDFLVHHGRPLFTEINPRFQGSTSASCRIAVDQGESCLMLDHLASFLDVPAPPTRHLRDWAAAVGDFGSLVVHNTTGSAACLDVRPLVHAAARTDGFVRADVLTNSTLRTQQEATIARITARSRLTATGFDLLNPWASVVRSLDHVLGSHPSPPVGVPSQPEWTTAHFKDRS